MIPNRQRVSYPPILSRFHFRLSADTHITVILWLVLPGLIALAIWPLIAEGIPIRADRGLHLIRLALLEEHIRNGMLYPRWLPEMMLGRGYPLLNYYGSGAYYLSILVATFGLSIYDSSVVTMILVVIIAGYGMYFFAADIFSIHGRWAALMSAAAYIYAPYFLLANIYERGAIAEATAQALMPWTLWCARRIFTTEQSARYAVLLSLMLAAVVFSHTLTILIFPPVLFAYICIIWWQTGHRSVDMRWPVFALFTAMGVMTFFWLPLIGERRYISDLAYGIAAAAFLPGAMWDWGTIVDIRWPYMLQYPVRLGVVQLAIAFVGAVFAVTRRRDAESWFFLSIAILSGVAIGRWAQPIWESHQLLLAIQSPWRLLSLINVSMAFFAGAAVAYIPFPRRQSVVVLALIIAFVFSYYPRLNAYGVLSRSDTEVTRPAVAQIEFEQGVEVGGEGSTLVQEFRPRWADRTLIFNQPRNLTAPSMDLAVKQSNAYTKILTVTTQGPAPLRFNDFYFPGWRVYLDGNTILDTYPSTNLGLLTVDMPPGTHQVTVTWAGTDLQRFSSVISLFSLTLLAWVSWRHRHPWLAVVPLGLLIWGIAALVVHPPLHAVQSPAQPVESSGIRLLGYRLEQSGGNGVDIYPYWYVLTTQSEDLRVRWQLRDDAGVVQAELVSFPYYNASRAHSWAPGTIVDDAYRMPLPPGLQAGTYGLYVQVEAEEDVEVENPARIGDLTLPSAVPDQTISMHPTNSVYGNIVRLAGFNVSVRGKPLASSGDTPIVISSGDDLRFTLYWQALAPLQENYHSYVHLSDFAGRSIAKRDQLPGPFFRPPMMWDTYNLQRDTHLLRIPRDVPSGVYWPSVGLYSFDELDILPVTQDGSPVPGDNYRLPPIKIVSKPGRPKTRQVANFEDGFRLLGYELQLPDDGLHPGDTFTVKLYYRSQRATEKDYTRFLHLHSPELGMAAQHDGLPQAGVNPTWAWVPGETIVDQVQLTIADDATPGQYRLTTGFYDNNAGGARLSVQDAADQTLPDDGVQLTTITVNPLDH